MHIHMPVQQQVFKILLLGESNSSKSPFFSLIDQIEEESSGEANVYLYRQAPDWLLEIYDIPSDNFTMDQCKLYFNLLPTVRLVVYFIADRSFDKVLRSWHALLQSYMRQSKIVFVSMVKTQEEKNKVIAKIKKEFPQEKHPQLHSSIYFPMISKGILNSLLSNICQVGIRIEKEENQKSFLRQSLSKCNII